LGTEQPFNADMAPHRMQSAGIRSHQYRVRSGNLQAFQGI